MNYSNDLLTIHIVTTHNEVLNIKNEYKKKLI